MSSRKHEGVTRDELRGRNEHKTDTCEKESHHKPLGGKLTDLCTLDLSKVTSSLQLPNAFSKLMQITKQLQNELRTTRKERDEAYNSLILQRDYYEQSATNRNCSKDELEGNFDTEYLERLLNNTASFEYRAELNNLKREYERKIKDMEKEFEEESKDLRMQILKDVEMYLIKYRDLAKLATEEAKRQKKKVEIMKSKTKELTEMTCKSFEEKLRKKMQEDLKKQEEATQSVYSKLLDRERSLQIKWNEREETLEREKKDFERSVMKQAEKRIEEFRRGFISTQAQLTKEREIFDSMMERLREKISLGCAEFEQDMYHRFAVTFNLDENEVSRRLQNYDAALNEKA